MIEKHRMRSGNRQMPSVKGRHNDNRQRKASDVFNKASDDNR